MAEGLHHDPGMEARQRVGPEPQTLLERLWAHEQALDVRMAAARQEAEAILSEAATEVERLRGEWVRAEADEVARLRLGGAHEVDAAVDEVRAASAGKVAALERRARQRWEDTLLWIIGCVTEDSA